MAIPDYQTLMLPLLRFARDGKEYRFRDAVESLAQICNLTEAERAELLPSGTAYLFDNRVGWSRSYLKQAGLLESPKRGALRITERGQSVLANPPDRIDVKFLEQFPEFRDFRSKRSDGSREVAPTTTTAASQLSLDVETPEDRLAAAYRQLRKDLELDLLDQVKASTPQFFEQLVIDLLVAMGYGGSRQDAGRAIGKSGDGGIDGIIKEDKLGLDVIYLQAKRWEGTVGRPEIQKFAGALQGHRASKGVFITTSSFTREALEYVNLIGIKIILMNGQELSALMVDYNVGVSTAGRYEVKKIDADYFEGE
jgi:restriction system protein